MWVGGVRVLIFNDDNELLMVKQKHEGKFIWMAPGGGIEENENSIEASLRELKEETNLEVKINEMVWHIEENSNRGQRFVNYFFGNVVSGELSLGIDPEFDENHQRMEELRYVSKQEMQTFDNVFPSYLKDELWNIYENKKNMHNVYKIRRKFNENI